MSDPAPTAQPGPPTLLVAHGLATIQLNRPHHHNRLEPEDIPRLGAHLAAIESDATIRAVILRADGKSFCAGYDLADLGRPLPPGVDEAGLGALDRMIDALERCRVPTICALNGPVFGGGTDLALACDFRVGVGGIRMLMPAATFGLHYYHSGLRRYVARLGLGAAKRLFLLGQPIDAQEMLRIGYLDEIVPDLAALETRTRDMAAVLLSAASAPVIDSMKRALDRIAAGDFDPAEADAAWHATRRSPAVGHAVAAARVRR